MSKVLPKQKRSLLLTVFLILIPMAALASPILSISNGTLTADDPNLSYTFALTTTEPVGSDLLVPISIDDPTGWFLPSSNTVAIPAGVTSVEFMVISLVPSGDLSSGPRLTLGPVTGIDIGSGTGMGSLPGYIPQLSIYGGGLTVNGADFFWTFDVVAPQPLSSNLFVPLVVGSPASFSINGDGVTIPNGSSNAQVFLYSVLALDTLSTGPEVSIVSGAGYTIGEGVAVGKVVPEPATLLLLGSGLLGLVALRRKVKK